MGMNAWYELFRCQKQTEVRTSSPARAPGRSAPVVDFPSGSARWAVCLKHRRTFGEAATSIFLPAGFIDEWDFPVSTCRPPMNMENTDGCVSLLLNLEVSQGPLVRRECLELAKEPGRWTASVCSSLSLHHRLGDRCSVADGPDEGYGSWYWHLCTPVLPSLSV